MPRKKQGSQAGLSALEMLTVVIIIAILAAGGVFAYSGHRRGARVRSAARQIATLLGTARTLAISQNSFFQAVLHPNTGGLWIDRVDATGAIVTSKVTTPDTWSAYVHIVELTIGGVPWVEGPAPILFRPDGTSQAARVVLRSEGEDSRSVGEFFTVKLYSSTARSRVFMGIQP